MKHGYYTQSGKKVILAEFTQVVLKSRRKKKDDTSTFFEYIRPFTHKGSEIKKIIFQLQSKS